MSKPASLPTECARGMLAGALATVLMSLLMAASRRAGLMGEMPPEKISDHFLDRLGVRRSARQQDALASLLHLAFGAGAGVLYAFARPRLKLPLPRLAQGMAFGSLVWLVSYQGWVPALGIMEPPLRDRPGRPQSMLAAHWVYGGTLALLESMLSRAAAWQRDG